MKKRVIIILACLFVLVPNFATASSNNSDYPIQPVEFNQVSFNDTFWAPRIATNRDVTIPFAMQKNEDTGRVDNFRIAAGKLAGKHTGKRYNDSDVFKVMEGAAYSLAIHPDPQLEKKLDELIAIIAAAQEDDGYLFTTRRINPQTPAEGSGPTRWSALCSSHELYNMGHMYEAAVAHFRATGKRSFLDIAIKNAEMLLRAFGPGKIEDFPGHQEIEIGLAKLYRVTGKREYIELARFFLQQRGRKHKENLYPESSPFSIYNKKDYLQNHLPVLKQKEAVGHAVRAGYMFSGMADVAALLGDRPYIQAIDRLWENVVNKKLYLTGGIGSRHQTEGFGKNYELPNATAYCETCAAIANAMWNHRLFLLHGDAKYIDVLERILYNGVIPGVSLSGDRFFYPNPLESDGKFAFNQGAVTRQPWFEVACCPGNIVRFLPSLPGYVYAHRGDTVYVNLFVQGKAKIETASHILTLKQTTSYPWTGKVDIQVASQPQPLKKVQKETGVTIMIRIPGWARNCPVPGHLYRYLTNSKEKPTLAVNGQPLSMKIEKGYAIIHRNWKKGDTISLNLPMPVRRVICHEKVMENRGKAAIERGPLVYCAEGIDNGGKVLGQVLPAETIFSSKHRADLLGGITLIEGKIPGSKQVFTAIPYYAWSHRGAGEMAVWFKL